ncbi:MAG: hypothetical protein IJL14_07760 [Selenomonadaceae bacterium]|nr:hypothetical protein [Selenomonadaceae bacterium]
MEMQMLDQDNLDLSKPINFAPRELTLFKEELDKQFAEGKGVDVFKALRNACYLAMLERGFKQINDGYGHFHDLIEVEDEQTLV